MKIMMIVIITIIVTVIKQGVSLDKDNIIDNDNNSNMKVTEE